MVPKVIPLPDEYQDNTPVWAFSAILEATDKTWQLMKLTVKHVGEIDNR